MTQTRSVSGPRVANVSYLNCAPFRALSAEPWLEYSQVEPAECARQLHEDEADLACIPVAEFLQSGGYQMLPYGIAATTAVQSVLLVSECPLEELELIYLDAASRTSVVLLKLLLNNLLPEKRIFSSETKIKFLQLPGAEALDLVNGRAGALLIGDLALKNGLRFSHRLDLGEAWVQQTGLPFVFAVWAYRPERLSPQIIEKITARFEFGLAQSEVFARELADELGLPREQAVSYLNQAVKHRLDQAALEGLSRFAQEASFVGLLPAWSQISAGRAPSIPSELGRIFDSLAADQRLSIRDALILAERASLHDLGLAATLVRERHNPAKAVSYIVDRNINYTNVCNVHCRFCAFYRAPGKKDGYVLTREEIAEKIRETVAAGGVQILLQGGLNPELGIEYYEDLFVWLKENFTINLHALSADEVMHIAEVSKLSIRETLKRLIRAGLGSLPGAGAELLVDRVRHRIARLKSCAADWLNVHRVAHQLGLISTCTMMFGVGETWEDRLLHLAKLRSLQDETGGFTAFISWSFQDENTSLKPADTSTPEYLRVQALSRIFLDNIPHIQSSWVTQGPSVGQAALFYGADDFGSVMFEENVVSAAGTVFNMNAALIEAHIENAGFTPWRRDVWYNKL